MAIRWIQFVYNEYRGLTFKIDKIIRYRIVIFFLIIKIIKDIIFKN